jgi:DNA-binding transcriptional ArsR family regulator
MATHTVNTRSSGEGELELPPDVVDSLLASPARRRILRQLRNAGEAMPVDDLAAAVAASAAHGEGTDTAAGEGEAVPTDRQRARADIYQRHLPRLTETGVVTFDSRLGTVEYTGGPRLTERLDEEP